MPEKARFDSDAARALVRERLRDSSSRALAMEIGISRGALESFVSGRKPYAKTRLRLASWQMKQGDPAQRAGRDELEAALALMRWYVESSPTNAVRARRVRELYDRLGMGKG